MLQLPQQIITVPMRSYNFKISLAYSLGENEC